MLDWGTVAGFMTAYYIVIYLNWWTAIAFALALTIGIYIALWLHDRNK